MVKQVKLTQSQKQADKLARRFCNALGEGTKWKPLRPASIAEVAPFADLRVKDLVRAALFARKRKWIAPHAASGGFVLTDTGRELRE